MNKEAQKEHMRQCLNAAIAMWDFCKEMAEADESVMEVEVSAENLKKVIHPFFPAFAVDDAQVLDCIERLDFVLGRYGSTSCGCFAFAHMLDHVFDLETLPGGAEPN